jgi:Fe2+ or Zn2+ uptake regulation protein
MSDEHVDRRRLHLLHTLKAAELPMPTMELYRSCPPEQTPWDDEPTEPGYTNVYHNLRQLEKRGLVRSIRRPGSRAVYWAAVLSNREAATFDALVAQLDTDAP